MLLDGVRVLDLSRLLPGGYCTQLLQAQGAQVTKIEPPAGDPIRALPGGNAYFEALHGGKQLLTLDLRSETGRNTLRGRVVEADVLVEGFRPGVMERMELGYPALVAINPALVYCAITGYGSDGPMAGRAGHDLNYLARSGALSLMPLREGTPTIPGLQVADMAGGLQGAFLIAGALVARARSRRRCAPPREPNGRPALVTRMSAWSRPCDSRNRRRTEAAIKTAPAVDRQLVIDVDDAAEQAVLLVVDAGGEVERIRTRPQQAVAEPEEIGR